MANLSIEQQINAIKLREKNKRKSITKKAIVTLSVIYSVYNIVDKILEVDYTIKNKKRQTQQDLQTLKTVCNFLKSL